MDNKRYGKARQQQISKITSQVQEDLKNFTACDDLIQAVIKMMMKSADTAFEDGFYSSVYLSELDRRTHFHTDHSKLTARQARRIAERGLDYEIDAAHLCGASGESKH